MAENKYRANFYLSRFFFSFSRQVRILAHALAKCAHEREKANRAEIMKITNRMMHYLNARRILCKTPLLVTPSYVSKIQKSYKSRRTMPQHRMHDTICSIILVTSTCNKLAQEQARGGREERILD